MSGKKIMQLSTLLFIGVAATIVSVGITRWNLKRKRRDYFRSVHKFRQLGTSVTAEEWEDFKAELPWSAPTDRDLELRK